MTADCPSASDLAARLAQCRADWLPKYFPAGKLRAGVFELGSADGDAGRSLPIPINGQPHLVDFAGGFAGDDLDLLARAIGGDSKAAYREALGFLGIAGKVTPRPEPRRPPPRPPKSRPLDPSQRAQTIWRKTLRIRRSRLALDYLVCRRGITAWDDDRLRWHPECPWGDERVGCIVAPVVCHRTGCTVAIWRIRPALRGKVERMALGPAKHNFSPVWPADGDELAIAEGIEDALAVHQLTGLPCWAALNAGNMEVLRGIPRWVRSLVIFTDVDGTGRKGAHNLAHAQRALGRHVRVVRPLNGKDPNDAALATASA